MLPGIYSIQVESGSSGHPRSNTVTITVSAPQNTITANTTTVITTTGTPTTTPVSIVDIKDCWFGDNSQSPAPTLTQFLAYQSDLSTNSGLKYLDELILYGNTIPAIGESITNILSYEETAWTSATGVSITGSTQLPNFFILRINSPGTRSWNIPATNGINKKFLGCFSRGDRPTTW